MKALFAVVALVVSGFAVMPAGATHPEVSLTGSNFEIDTDANLRQDDSSPSIDWASASVTEVRKPDTPSGPDDESFGQGTDENDAEPVVVDGSIPPNKSDLKFFGLYQEGATSNGFLNLYWSRVQEPTGTTNMDFELNQLRCTPNQNPVDEDCAENGITPKRTAGDKLITYDLAKGGTVPVISIRSWSGTEWSSATELSTQQDPQAQGSINTSTIPQGESDGLGAHTPRTFGEAQIKLSALFTGVTGCDGFGSAYLKSRASDAFPSALKDFVPPEAINITNCGLINIIKTDDAGTRLNGAEFTLYNDVGPSFGPPDGNGTNQDQHGGEDTATTLKCMTSGSGTNAGTCTINNVPFGKYWVVETVTPANHNTAPDQYANLTESNASITLTFINNRQPATVKVKKVDDDDPANPLGGVTFTLYTDSAPLGPPDGEGPNQDTRGAEDSASSYSCTTKTTSNATTEEPIGTCTISNILNFGSYWVVEGTPPSGHTAGADQHVTVSAGQTYNLTTTPFVNPRQFKVIVLVCRKSDSKLYASGVKFDAETSATNTLGTGATLPDGVSEADLCSLGGATHDDVHRGEHSAPSINIPQ